MCRETSCPLSCCSEMVLDSCPAKVVPLGSEDCWFDDELAPGAPFMVLVGSEVEEGKRVRTASTIVGMSSLVKGSWTRLLFEGGVVVEAPLTSLSPERVCLQLCWFLAGPLIHLSFLRGGIIDTKNSLLNDSWHRCTRCTQNFLHLIHVILRMQIFSLMPIVISEY